MDLSTGEPESLPGSRHERGCLKAQSGSRAIRRRFPAIRVIAMSGAFSGNEPPLGVAADAFYEKGTGLAPLLQMVEAMTRTQRPSLQPCSRLAPIWIPKNGHDPSGEAYVTISCPECLRSFPKVLGKAICLIHETGCIHCSNLIHYAIVQPVDQAPLQTLQQKPGGGIPPPLNVSDLN